MALTLGMPVCRVDRRIDAPPKVVWELLTDVREWPRWGPSVRRAELRGGGSVIAAGARGTVWTVAGVTLPFIITEFEPDRRWGWQVAGLPATGHELVAEGAGCRVAFEVPWWAGPYLAVCAAALNRIGDIAVQSQ